MVLLDTGPEKMTHDVRKRQRADERGMNGLTDC